MNMATKKDIFQEHLERYLAGSRTQKGAILTHVCFVTGMHRKAATRKFRAVQLKRSSTRDHRGRKTVYGPDVTAALKLVWEAGNEVCGELLFPVMAEYVEILQRDGMWPHSEEATTKLRQMSLATVKRRVGAFLKARDPRKGISSTSPSQLKHLVPTFTGPWTDYPPGFGQLDTVLHNDTALGEAVFSVNYTDAATMTVGLRAQWGKGQRVTQESIEAIQHQLPFDIRGMHPDSGSEFLNWLLKTWADEQDIQLTRSRPSRKNDNMYVEERNGHVVRKFVGYVPLTCREVVPILNTLYDVLTPYLLHFVAVRRQVVKERVGAKYRRVYEPTAKTPYQRILEHPGISNNVKTTLREQHARLNPLVLKREIERRLAAVYATQRRYGKPRV